MILLFPNLDTFRLAVTSGTVPPEMALSPAVVSRDDGGRIFVETNAKLSKKGKDALDRLKVLGSKRHGGAVEKVASWLQVLPLTPDAGPPQLSTQAPVLFELSSPELLPGLVAEMLRLGNDRQSYRTLTDGDDQRVLLRVIGPPYYTLLRAIDKLSFAGGTVRAYTEQAPRVWVELGFSHPFAKQIKFDDGQIVLIRPPHEWAYLPDAGYQDVYDVLNFTLPNAASEWVEAPTPARITVPLKLAAGNATDMAEMWVLRGGGIAQLDALVRDSDDRLTEQLRFAVGASPDGEEVVILGVAPSKKEPPVMALDGAVAFKSYWRIPNLFLPVGTRLHPTVRRDVVTKLLAEDRDRRVWLFPGADGSFVPEAISENAFRPLGDWVEYVIGASATDLREWIAATEFDFESFICTDGGPKPKPDREKPEREKREKDERETPVTKPIATKTAGKKSTTNAAAAVESLTTARPPSAWKVRCDELEREFRDRDGPLDSPERLELWPQLAAANAAMGDDRKGEAAICWVNALWNQPAAGLIDGWADCETPNAPRTAAELDARLAVPSPTPSQVRALASLFLAVAQGTPDWLKPRLPAVQKFLEAHETKLPVRGAWLAAVRLAQLSGTDVLGLARVRDRVLGRLLERGLSAEQDLPTFLRFAGLKNSERLRVVRERMVDLHRAARKWAEQSLQSPASVPTQVDSVCTLAYLDLMFAFGLAKLGEGAAARAIVESAQKTLGGIKTADTKGIVANYLFKVFRSRIDDALADKPTIGPLSRELLDELEAINATGGKAANDPHKLAYYVISRMRQQSEIVDPQEKNDPYADWQKQDELKKELAELPRLKDAATLRKRVLELFKVGVRGQQSTPETRFAVLHQALPLTPRVGQDFVVEMLRHVPALFQAMPPSSPGQATEEQAKKEGAILERALFLAAHYDQNDLVQSLVDQFIAHVRKKPDEQRFVLVNIVAGRSLKSLRKVGLRDEVDKLLRRMQDEILKGKTLGQLKAQYAAKGDVWAEVLQTLLNLAAGWQTFGLHDQAEPILAAAREEILTGQVKMGAQKFASLGRTYVAAVGQGPADSGMLRLIELFQKLDPARITNRFTSAPYYSRLHLNLIESTVLAVVSDDFALGQSGKQWLDEDEQLVRKRIHRDMRDLVKRTGV
ncbi:hypothetical protein [Limnoglobus roseus]|uniref:FtsH ternary system domain-containing protein n=1 Tax=Limnoglobus roseus TaxID=2598579 RepID=A0A5C1A8A6_9BACT|nr:hypothetical protein [Limnoglobus roseus]QEL14002.1 hypothetical protein PX52LOC_00863 [Limnoglobus roseus]